MIDRIVDVKNKVLGALVGLGIGDRYHGPTDRALVLGNHLIENKELDVIKLTTDYINYYNEMGSDLGATQSLVLGKLAKDGFKSLNDIKDATYQVHMWRRGKTASIGAAHRSVPLAIWHISRQISRLEESNWLMDLNFKKMFATALAEESKQEGAITHFDPLAGEASAFSNLLVAACILNINNSTTNLPPEKGGVLKLVTEFCELADMNEELLELLKNPTTNTYDHQKFGYYFDTIACALEVWWRKEKFEEILVEGWNVDRPNYVGVLTGLWGGALFGISSIPKKYIEGNYRIERLANLGKKMIS